jgi:hypothetical protein
MFIGTEPPNRSSAERFAGSAQAAVKERSSKTGEVCAKAQAREVLGGGMGGSTQPRSRCFSKWLELFPATLCSTSVRPLW